MLPIAPARKYWNGVDPCKRELLHTLRDRSREEGMVWGGEVILRESLLLCEASCMNFSKCGSIRFFEKLGKFWVGPQSPSIWKIELWAQPLPPRTYFLTYSLNEFLIWYEGGPESVPPIAPHRLFWKFGALAFPNLLSEKSAKIQEEGDRTWA